MEDFFKSKEIMNEDALIRKIRKQLNSRSGNLEDDCAVLPLNQNRKLLVSTDMLIEGVDFDLSYCRPEDIGYKSAMVNLSDIAAMGGQPADLFFSIGMPKASAAGFVTGFYRGVKAALRGTSVKISGGDLSSSDKVVISGTVLGKVSARNIKYRSGAKAGDIILAAGHLGWSAAGLCMLQRSGKKADRKNPFVKFHLRPQAQTTAGKILGAAAGVHTMIDISDGLSTDLNRICSASQVGAVVYQNNLPVREALRKTASKLKKDPIEWVLNGGEDFALLFTCEQKSSAGIVKRLKKQRIPVSEIGVITGKTSNVCLQLPDGKNKPLKSGGYDHLEK